METIDLCNFELLGSLGLKDFFDELFWLIFLTDFFDEFFDEFILDKFFSRIHSS